MSDKKSVLFDLTAIGENKTGIEFYALSLLGAIIEKLVKRFDVILLTSDCHLINSYQGMGGVSVVKTTRNKFLSNLFVTPYYILRFRPSVAFFGVFPPFIYFPLFKFFSSTRYIRIVYDAVLWRYPKTLSLKNKCYYKPFETVGMRFYDKILTISDFSRRDIVNFFPNCSENITNIGAAFVERHKSCGDVFDEFFQPYFLFVGTVDKRKNINVILEAISLAKKRGSEFVLCIAGRAAWGSKELNNKINELKIHDNVRLLGYVDDEHMQELYVNATGFLFPSIYEGFGMPVVEAMSAGCPVIASNNSAIPEAAGGAAVLVDDYLAPDSWLVEMERLLGLSAADRQILVARGVRRVEELSWSAVAQKTLSAIEGL